MAYALCRVPGSLMDDPYGGIQTIFDVSLFLCFFFFFCVSVLDRISLNKFIFSELFLKHAFLAVRKERLVPCGVQCACKLRLR